MTIPSEAHFHAFGLLIYHYAKVESGLKICLSGILDQSLAITLILTEPYGAVHLRNVVKSVAKEYTFPTGGQQRLMQIVGDIGPHAALRNYIAHSRWTDGKRPGSIKPRGIDIRSGRAVFIGDNEDEQDWTAPEIEAAAKSLFEIDRRILQFNDDMGLTPRILAHMSDTSETTD